MRPFFDDAVLRKAEFAARDTPLGIIDSLAREYLIYWFPETESFLDAEPSDDFEDDVAEYTRLAAGLIEHLLKALVRIDGSSDEDALSLRDATMKHVQRHLERLNDTCGDIVEAEEILHFSPPTSLLPLRPKSNSSEAREQTAEARPEVLSEARILNSSLAWDLTEASSLKSTAATQSEVQAANISTVRKRGFSEAQLYDDYEAADNGQAWTRPGVLIKRQKFEVKFRQVIEISIDIDSETHDDSSARRNATRKTTKQHKENVIDLTEENVSMQLDPMEHVETGNGLRDEQQCEPELEREFRLPGSFY